MLRGAPLAFRLRAEQWTNIANFDQLGFFRFLTRRSMQRVHGASVDHL